MVYLDLSHSSPPPSSPSGSPPNLSFLSLSPLLPHTFNISYPHVCRRGATHWSVSSIHRSHPPKGINSSARDGALWFPPHPCPAPSGPAQYLTTVAESYCEPRCVQKMAFLSPSHPSALSLPASMLSAEPYRRGLIQSSLSFGADHSTVPCSPHVCPLKSLCTDPPLRQEASPPKVESASNQWV